MPDTNAHDIHQKTLDSDAEFHRLMSCLYGEDWREKIAPPLQRRAAKSYNFSRLYGTDSRRAILDNQ